MKWRARKAMDARRRVARRGAAGRGDALEGMPPITCEKMKGKLFYDMFEREKGERQEGSREGPQGEDEGPTHLLIAP